MPAKKAKGRPRRAPKDRNRTVGVTPSKDTREWLDPQIGPGKRWATFTHFVDWAANFVREADAGKGK